METKFTPILYQQDMVLACLDGTKTQTRRIKKLEIVNKNPDEWILDGLQINGNFIFHNKNTREEFWVKSPYGNSGDILWVRETFREIEQDNGKPRVEYRASEPIYLSDKWKPSIHMPKTLSRIFLQVISLKIERIQDISENDSIAEGVLFCNHFKNYKCYLCEKWHYLHQGATPLCEDGFYKSAKDSFNSLWGSIYSQASLLHNPWVWVIEFEHIDKPDNFI